MKDPIIFALNNSKAFHCIRDLNLHFAISLCPEHVADMTWISSLNFQNLAICVSRAACFIRLITVPLFSPAVRSTGRTSTARSRVASGTSPFTFSTGMSSEGTPVSVSRQLLLSIKKPHRFTSRYGRNDSETKAKFCSVKPTPPTHPLLQLLSSLSSVPEQACWDKPQCSSSVYKCKHRQTSYMLRGGPW